MKFKSLRKLVLESQYPYQVPDRDLEKQIVDFYISSMHLAVPKNAAAESMLSKAYEESSEALSFAHEQLVNSLYPLIKEAVLFSLCSEFRHIVDYDETEMFREAEKASPGSAEKLAEAMEKMEKSLKRPSNLSIAHRLTLGLKDEKPPVKFSDPRLHKEKHSNTTARLNSYSILTSTFKDNRQLVETMKAVFKCKFWIVDFGGSLWSSIADAWLQLDSAKTTAQKSVAIDHILDLQHNNNSVFDKVQYFFKDGGYEWLGNLLSLKRHAKTPWELYDYASAGMQKIMAPYLKASGLGAKDVQNIHPLFKKVTEEFNVRDLDSGTKKTIREWVEFIDIFFSDDNEILFEADHFGDYPLIEAFVEIYMDRINWANYTDKDMAIAINDGAFFLYPIAMKHKMNVSLEKLKNGLESNIDGQAMSKTTKTTLLKLLKRFFKKFQSVTGQRETEEILKYLDSQDPSQKKALASSG